MEEIDEQIIRYLQGEASPEEAMWLEDWKQRSADNQALFDQSERLYAYTHEKPEFATPDVSARWKALEKTLPEPHNLPVRHLFVHRSTWIAAAASIVLLIGIAGWWHYGGTQPGSGPLTASENTGTEKTDRILASGAVKAFTLQDQSHVELASGSELILDKGFNQTNRRLRLKGSGRFEVIHNDRMPFEIAVNKLKVLDIGTIFEVTTQNDTVKVVVEEGEVLLKLNEKSLGLVARDSAYYVISKDILRKYALVAPVPVADKVYIFEDASLKEIVHVLNEVSDKEIVIRNAEIEACKLTVTFRNEDLATMLEIIAQTLEVSIVHTSKTIELYGKSCE
jgi:transmembrane sensor